MPSTDMGDVMAKDNNTYPVACNVSGGSLPDGYKITLHVDIDFSDVSENQMKQWAASNRVIALQRNLRTLTTKTLEEMSQSTVKVHASQCGMKVQSKEETIAKFKSAFSGMDDETRKEVLESLKV